jgi:hypothetical protein
MEIIIRLPRTNYSYIIKTEHRCLKRSAKVAIIAGICAAVIIGGSALFVHLRLSEIEKNETEPESAEQIAKEALEVLSGKEPHSEEGEESESEELHSEESESIKQNETESP